MVECAFKTLMKIGYSIHFRINFVRRAFCLTAAKITLIEIIIHIKHAKKYFFDTDSQHTSRNRMNLRGAENFDRC